MDKGTKINEKLYYDERSAGGIVYRTDEGRIKWLLIKTYAKKYQHAGGEDRKIIYKFPKGHTIEGEVLKQTALREVEEEGKIKAKILTKIGSRDYILWDKEEKKKIIKKVTFFLMEYVGPSALRHYDMEAVLDREWFTYEETIERLAYDFEKALLTKAKNKLEEMKRTEGKN